MTKRCTHCSSIDVRRAGARAAEVRAHALRSPYRCLECGTRFWVLSRKTRFFATTAGIAAVFSLIAFFSVPLWDARHAFPVWDPDAAPQAHVSAPDDAEEATAAALQAELDRTQSELRGLGDLSAGAGRPGRQPALR